MNLKSHFIGSLCLLTALIGIQQPLMAAKRHKDSSLSSSNCCSKQKKCCKKTLARLSQIDQTTVQDLLVDQQTLNTVNQINQTTMNDLQVDREILNVVSQLLQSSCMIIDQKSIDDAGGTLTLIKSGKYCVVEDVQGMIVVQASDISIDLQSHVISANGGDNAIVIGSTEVVTQATDKRVVQYRDSTPVVKYTQASKEVGDFKRLSSLVDPDNFLESREPKAKAAISAFGSACTVHNIQVFNGTVEGSLLAGIMVNAGCDVYIHDLEFFNNTLDGLQVVDSQNLRLEKVAFSAGNSAINIDGLNQGTLFGINIYDHTAITDNLVTIQNTDGLNLVDVNATGNSKVAPANIIRYSTRGFFAIWDSVNFSVTNLNLSSSTIDNTQGSPTIFFGLYLFSSNNGFFQNFQFNTSQTINNPISFFGAPLSAFGPFGALSFSENITVVDSTVNDNLFLAPDGAYSGYFGFGNIVGNIAGKDWRFERCQVNRNNGNLSTGWLFGDSGNDAGNATVKDCQFNDNVHDVMLFMRGISFEADANGSKVLTVENFQANRNIAYDVDPSLFPDTEALLTFPDNNCLTLKNIQFNYNQISHAIQLATLNIWNNNVWAEGIECNNNTIGFLYNGATVGAIIDLGTNQKYTDVQCNQNIVQKGHENGPFPAWFGGVVASGASQTEISSLQCCDNHIQGPEGAFDNTLVAGVYYELGSDLKIRDSFIARNSGGAETICAGVFVVSSSNVIVDGNELIETGLSGNSSNYLLVTDPPVIVPLIAILADYSPPFVPTSGVGEFADPLNGCSVLSNDLTNKIGIAQRGSCSFTTKTADIEAAGAVGTVIINTSGAPFAMTGSPTGNYPSVMISTADGAILTDAITNNEGLVLSIVSNLASSDNSFGLYFDDVSNSKVIRTEALSNLSDGFHLTESCSDCIVENCHAMGNQGAGFVDESNFQNSYFGNKAQANGDPQYSGIASGNISTYDRTTGLFNPTGVSSLTNIDVIALP